MSLRRENLTGDADGVWDARVKHIVGVDEEDGGLWVDLCILFERRVLILEEHDPAVRHSARDGNIKLLPCRDRRRHVDAADVRCSSPIGCRVHIVRAPRTEVRNFAPLGGTHDARRLCRDEGLMVDLREDRRLHKLCVDDRCNNRQERLIRIDDRSLRHSVDVAAKTETAQEVQEFLGEEVLFAEIGNVRIGEREILHELDDVLKPRKDGVAPLVGDGAEKEIERHANIAVRLMKISIGHGHFVEIHHHG